MKQLVRLEADDAGVARIVLSNPPENGLTHLVRLGLISALERAEADPAIKVILLEGEGRCFAGGRDVRAYDRKQMTPGAGDLCRRVEDCPKPVIAVLHGAVSGAGCELALAAHYRLASAHCQLILPDIRLGLTPAAGGTQRLPRLVGAQTALDMLLSGAPLMATAAQRHGLVDKLAEGDLAAAARAYAASLLADGKGPQPTRLRRDGLRDSAANQAALAHRRKEGRDSPLIALGRIVDCVEAALLLPFDAGLVYEAEAYRDCLDSEASRALRHVAVAEWRAAQTEAAETPAEFAIVGEGGLAVGWAAVCLNAGVKLHLVEADETALAATRDKITALMARTDPSGARLARLRAGTESAVLALADLVIAAGEPAARLAEAAMRPEAVLAVAVPAGQETALDRLARPGHALAFFGAPQTGRVTEIGSADTALPGTEARARHAMMRLGRLPVRTLAETGGIGATVWETGMWAVDALVQMGVPPVEIEAAMAEFGFARGPFDGRRAAPSRAHGYDITAGEVVQRVLAAMANAGALLLSAGVAERPSDIDLVMVSRYGFPRWHGGPMFAADNTGLMVLKNTLNVLRDEDKAFWAPAPLLSELIKNGRHFADMNGG